MKNIITLLMLISISFAYSQDSSKTSIDIKNDLKKKIITAFDEINSHCSPDTQFITRNSIINNKKSSETVHFWNICKQGNKRIIRIEFYKDETLFQELYFEQKDQLVYAVEATKYLPPSYAVQSIWNIQYYLNNNEIFDYISLGHGKTERDDWNPDSIITIYQHRRAQLKNMKK